MDKFRSAAEARMDIAGYNVPVVNAPYMWASELGNELCQGEPFAATYYDTAEARVFSLRSKDDGVDVSEIASEFGGGGHRNAAGFRVPLDELEQFKEVSDADGGLQESASSQGSFAF